MRRLFDLVPRVLAIVIAVVVILGVITLVLLTAFGAFAGTGNGPSATHTKANSAGRATGNRYYVSLGDSYAVGYQPSPSPGPTAGYTGVVTRSTRLRLANFGCGGATTTSILDSDGCAAPYGPPASSGAVDYPHQTQEAAATAFIRRHRGDIGLITVSIGGNDVTHCASVSDPTACVLAAVPRIEKNVTALATHLREAAGRHVPLIGLTYPDVLLGLWVYPSGQADTSLATLSVTAFRTLLNPALEKAYAAAGGHFVDVTKEAGGYVPLTETTKLVPYGTVPVAVARTCRLTWYCTQGNIHANTAGYHLIGTAVVRRFRDLTR